RSVLVVYCHPCPESFSAAIRDAVCDALHGEGHTVDLLDLYDEGFEPAMPPEERRGYHQEGPNLAPVRDYAERLARADALIFVYPTWWFGLPAMLKGWLDRVLLPGFAFVLRPDAMPQPGLAHIRHLGVFTSCGATWMTSWLMGFPGRRTLLRGLRANCHPRVRTSYRAIYRIDTADATARTAYLSSIPGAVSRLMKPQLGQRFSPASPSQARRTLAE
ncbi:MAG: NAD(P)H-dependent oxidoreductase, partial [Rhodosalinus sp.]